MTTNHQLFRMSRRTLVLGGVITAASPAALAQELPRVTVMKDESCGCCDAWVEHIRASGFTVTVENVKDINRVKAKLGVPRRLTSCHTAQVGPYVVEGHVPAEAIKRLLSERPMARGLAVPGMPVGSPGMEAPGQPLEVYEVMLFDQNFVRAYGRYEGSRSL